AYYTNADPVQVKKPADQLTISDMLNGDIVYFGLSQVTIKLGDGGNTVTIDDGVNTGTTTIQTGDGNDNIAVRRTNGSLTLNTGAGTDTIDVGSWAGFWNGTLTNPVGTTVRNAADLGHTNANGTGTSQIALPGANGIVGTLTIDGGTQADTVNIEDA